MDGGVEATCNGGPVSLYDVKLSLRILTAFWFLLCIVAVSSSAIAEAESIDPVIVRTFTLVHADVRHLKPILQPLLTNAGSLSIDERTNSIVVRDLESSAQIIRQTIEKLDREMPSQTFYLNYANPEQIGERIEQVLGPNGNVVVPDERTNSVYVMTTPTRLERVASLVTGWDRLSKQVLIEADILDVSSAKIKELGIEWELRLGYGADNKHDAVFSVGVPRASADEPASGGVTFGTPTVTIPPVVDGMGNVIVPGEIIPGSDFSAAIEALIEDSSTRTLSRPRIMAIDGQTARFEVSTLEPYANTRFDTHGNAASLDIEFLDIGIILEAIPHINSDGYVTMDIRPEVSTLVREEFFGTTIIPDEGGAITNNIRVPVKSQNRASTTVMVRDMQTIAIGGLRTREETDTVRKVPILGDIPVLGLPFRNLNKGKERRELIIFITPRIVSAASSSPEADMLDDENVVGASDKQETKENLSRRTRTNDNFFD